MASPTLTSYSCASGGEINAGRSVIPDWQPALGEVRQISRSAGYFGPAGGATLAEIEPINQPWHPAYGSGTSFDLPFGIPGMAGWSSQSSYCGYAYNPSTRQLVHYGAGHSAINVPAPYAFDLAALRWMWLDQPLPFDGYAATAGEAWPLSDAAVAAHYPNGELDYTWSEILGDSTTWGALARPGIIQPIPGHSRANLVCVPAAGAGNTKGLLIKHDAGSGKVGGVLYNSSHGFNFATGRWARFANQFPGGPGTAGGKGTTYDPTYNKVISYGKALTYTADFWVLDVPSGSWTTRTASNTKQTAVDTSGALVHEAAGLFIAPAARNAGGTGANGPGTGLTFDFLAVPTSALASTSGTFDISTLTVDVASTWPRLASGYNDYLGWAYCPADKCLYCATCENGTNKYWRLRPPVGAQTTEDYLMGTWTLSEHAFSTGTWVRSVATLFQYSRLNAWDARSRSFIWHSGGVNDPVMAWRPAALEG